MHQNIAGLINKSDRLILHVKELQERQVQVDVICVTEHFMPSGHEDILSIPNYQLASYFSRKTKCRGGACILVRNGLRYKELTGVKKYSVPNYVECCAVELLDHKTIIICLYRVPLKKENYDIFYECCENILKKVYNKKDVKIILCGDFNINILNNTRQTQEFQNLLLSYNLKLEFNEPTRLISKTCLDNFAHNIRRDCKGDVLDLGLSDHTAQLLQLPVKKTYAFNYLLMRRRHYSNENLTKFKSYLSNYSFTEICHMEDPNKAYCQFMEFFNMLYEQCFPEKIIRKPINRKEKWISRGIKICSKKQRKLLWAYRLSPTDQNKAKFDRYKNMLKRIIKLTKKAQNNHLIRTSCNKSKTTWQIINKNKNMLLKPPINTIKTNNTIITDPIDIAKCFNDYFIDKISSTDESISPMTSSTGDSFLNSMFLELSTSNDIIKIIKSLKNTNSVGHDGLSTKVIKFVSEAIAQPLSHILNVCIEKGTFPDLLKIAIIKPMFKKEDPENMKYYRPLAMLSVISKIFEKYIHQKLYLYLTKRKILCPEQKGFQKNKTIDMAIFDHLNYIIMNIDKRIPICSIFMDMSSAFDCVDHRILLNKLQSYGIRGNVLRLFEKYLCNRMQITEISNIDLKTGYVNTFSSNPKKVKYGVPQGSVLGPLLFLIYINDLPRHITQPLILFADDSTAIIKCNNFDEYENDINKTLIDVIKWLKDNNLQINVDKTKIIHFCQRSKPPQIRIAYEDNVIEEVSSTKFLGLVIDSKITWKPHTEELLKKLSRSAYALHQLRKEVNLDAVVTSYHGFVSSALKYGIIFWGNCSNNVQIFKAQKRCIRAMCNLKNTDSCAPYFKKLKLMPLPCIYIYEIGVFVHSHLYLFSKKSNARMRNVPLRSPYINQLSLPSCKTALMRKNIINMAPLIYNKIPQALKEFQSHLYKAKLKKFLIDKCYYNIHEFLSDQTF